MAGFPIVSLGSLTCINGWSSCKLISPQFEVDQYYQGDEEQAIQTYKERYPTAVSKGYIKSYTVNPNNLELTKGTQSTVSYSYGFYFHDDSDNYGIRNKLENILLYRVDSFYATTLSDLDYYCFMLKLNTNYIYSNYVSIYVNLPNILNLENSNSFSSGSKVKNVFINSPKAQDIGNYFLRYNTTITDLYMNATNISQITGTSLLYYTN